MVEDPALFLVFDLNGFWLWVTKLVAGIVAVQVYRAAKYMKGSFGRHDITSGSEY